MLGQPVPQITSIFGRVGQVTAQTGDYSWSQIGSIPTILQNLGSVSSSGFLEHTGSGTIQVNTVTTFSKTFLTSNNAAEARLFIGATTLGSNLITLANPSAIRFPRVNANNTVSLLSATDFCTAISAATSNHTHFYDSVITLTPQNSFTTFVGSGLYENSLTVYPTLKLAILRFALSRTSIPANQTVALSWSSSYSTSRGIIGFSPAVNLGGMTNSPLVFAYIDGNELKFNYALSQGGSSINYLIGTVTFIYA